MKLLPPWIIVVLLLVALLAMLASPAPLAGQAPSASSAPGLDAEPGRALGVETTVSLPADVGETTSPRSGIDATSSTAVHTALGDGCPRCLDQQDMPLWRRRLLEKQGAVTAKRGAQP